MSEFQPVTSWLSNQPINVSLPFGPAGVRQHHDVMGTWLVAEGCSRYGFSGFGEIEVDGENITGQEKIRLAAYLRASIFRAKARGKETFILFEEDFEFLQIGVKAYCNDCFQIDPRKALAYIRNASFIDKTFELLLNIRYAEEEPLKGLQVPVNMSRPGSFMSYGTPSVGHNLLYGLSEREGIEAIRYLMDNDYLVKQNVVNLDALYFTPHGWHHTEQMLRGQQGPPTGFMVCRFTPEMQERFNVIHRIGAERAEVALKRVIDHHHVDRITDKIVHEIQNSTVVVVDLSGENIFNVAFEAGYALALGKPIVWMIEDDGKPDFRPPFDIQNENILRYKPDEVEETADLLHYRLLAAVEKARNK